MGFVIDYLGKYKWTFYYTSSNFSFATCAKDGITITNNAELFRRNVETAENGMSLYPI
jgi:hypothetical protein